MILKVLGVLALAGVGVVELSACRAGAVTVSSLELSSVQGGADCWDCGYGVDFTGYSCTGDKCKETSKGSGVFEHKVGKDVDPAACFRPAAGLNECWTETPAVCYEIQTCNRKNKAGKCEDCGPTSTIEVEIECTVTGKYCTTTK